MNQPLDGDRLFGLFMQPWTTAAEVAALDLEALTRTVEYRRKMAPAAVSAEVTDEHIARAILAHARGETAGRPAVGDSLAGPPGEPRLACPECGSENPPDCIFCLSCGAMLPAPPPKAAAAPAPRPLRKAKPGRLSWWLAGACFLAVVMCVGGILRSRTMNKERLIEQYQRGERDFEGLELPGADLSRARLSGINLSRANLSAATLSGADLRWADLREADLRQADLTEVRLEGALLQRARLEGARLEGARLNGTWLEGADLRRAGLREADLAEARLEGARLEGANLSRAKVTDEQLARAQSLKGATMPDGSVHQ